MVISLCGRGLFYLALLIICANYSLIERLQPIPVNVIVLIFFAFICALLIKRRIVFSPLVWVVAAGFVYVGIRYVFYGTYFSFIVFMLYCLVGLYLIFSNSNMPVKIPAKWLYFVGFFCAGISTTAGLIAQIRAVDSMVLVLIVALILVRTGINAGSIALFTPTVFVCLLAGSRASLAALVACFAITLALGLSGILRTLVVIVAAVVFLLLTIWFGLESWQFELRGFFEHEERFIVWAAIFENYFASGSWYEILFGFGRLPEFNLLDSSLVRANAWILPHNDLISIMAIGGVLGLSLILGGAGLIVLFKTVKNQIAIVTTFIVLGMFDNPSLYAPTLIVLLLSLRIAVT